MVGPELFLESRTATRSSGQATSTQLPLVLKLLVRHTVGLHEVILVSIRI